MAGTDGHITDDTQAHLLRAERQIAWLRWIGMAGWLYILLGTGEVPGWPVWLVYGGGLVFTLTAHLRVSRGLTAGSIGPAARVTTIGDPILTTAMCFVTGGLASVFFPFYYFTLLAAAFRYGAREAAAVLIFNVALTGLLYLAVPGADLNRLAVAVFYLAFSALLGVLLANWAEENLAVAHERSRALRGARDRARMLLQRLINSQEDERKRIAGDIHDRMSGHLFALRQNVDRIREDAQTLQHLHQPLDRLDVEVRDTSSEVRRLMNELRPTVLDELGLAPAIEEYLAELHGTLSFDITFEADPAARSWRGRGDMALFRIFQEALLNIRKHAGANHVSITLRQCRDQNGNDIVLSLRDDGTGFDPSASPRLGHLGLLTMRERAEAVGGRLEIVSAPGQGTLVTAQIPGDPA
jgi:signal transduction histidine kinase